MSLVGKFDSQITDLNLAIQNVQAHQGKFENFAKASMEKVHQAAGENKQAGAGVLVGTAGALIETGFAIGNEAEVVGNYVHAGALAATASIASIGDIGRQGAYYVTASTSKALTALAHMLNGKAEVVETGKGEGAQWSHAGKVMDLAKKQVQDAIKDQAQANDAAHMAVAHAALAVVSTANFADSAGDMVVGLTFAAGAKGIQGADEAAEYGLRAARVSIMLAKEAANDSADLLATAAQISARAANSLADSNDSTIKIVVTPAEKAKIEAAEARCGIKVKAA